MSKEALIDECAAQVEEILRNHVADQHLESFLAMFCEALRSGENRGLQRFEITNRVQQRLHASRQPVSAD